MTALFERKPGPGATAAEIRRAHAHRLLDEIRAGVSQATKAEVAAALRITGDSLPLTRERHGLASATAGTQEQLMT